MTHSFEQDAWLLAALLKIDPAPALIGALGPRSRTLEMLMEATGDAALAGQGMSRLHSPVGLDLGGEAPAAVALSILAEAHQAVHGATARPLREVRG